MYKIAISSLLILMLSVSAGFAQTDNIGHTRHQFHHNDPHEKVIDPSRFFTNRGVDPLPLPTEEDVFVFGVFGDRTGGPASGVSILADAVHDINLFEPEFVMTVGDLVQGYNTTSQWIEQMKEYKGIMNELLCPWFPVAGNHDIYWRGNNRPEAEHEANYEMYFGPLWYAFEHKNSWFIVLYSDEGNPKTGEKAFSKPAAQRMSEEQFTWLKSILEKSKDADHVFLFLHHPRWTGGNYGDDWDKVHQELVRAGNVSAVFAGHIHRMRSDVIDGIEYFTLATVGGGQGGHSPDGGWLHQYNLVAVRKDQIAIVSVPVGDAQDPREITAEVSSDTQKLANIKPIFLQPLKFNEDQSVDQILRVRLENPTDNEVNVSLFPESKDSRWSFSPNHTHKTLEPNGKLTMEFAVRRDANFLDDYFRLPQVTLEMEYVSGNFGYTIPEKTVPVALNLSTINLKPSADNLVLELDGENDVLRVDSKVANFPDGPFTLEAWFKADSFNDRTALIAKTQSAEYGFYTSKGQPSFIVHLDDKYSTAKGEANSLETGRLYHIAGVFDGQEVRLYLDGKLIDTVEGKGSRTRNDLDLLIGGDVDSDNTATSTFDGQIHGMRLSKKALYAGDTFTPPSTFEADKSTVFSTNMDVSLLNWVINTNGENNYGVLQGGAKLVGVGE